MRDKSEGPEGPSSCRGKRGRLAALVPTPWPTSCMPGFEGSLVPCRSLMVSGHFGATTDEKGRWEPIACLCFPMGGGLTTLVVVRLFSLFLQSKAVAPSGHRRRGLKLQRMVQEACRVNCNALTFTRMQSHITREMRLMTELKSENSKSIKQ